MKIAVAQIKPRKGNILENCLNHKKMIQLAVTHRADSVFFPELSLTGYEPELAGELVDNIDDKIFDDFQKISNDNSVAIGIGVPTKINQGIRISMLVFQPYAGRQIYSKRQLHADEFPFFVSGDSQRIVMVNGVKIAPAICYESMQESHADVANQLGADIYVACVAKSQKGVEQAINYYPTIAEKFSMPVLMSSCVGFCDNFQCGGRSSVWTSRGYLAGQLNDKQEGILIFDTVTDKIIKQTI